MEKIVLDSNNFATIVQSLYQMRFACSVYTFEGPLGAGKTTLVKALLKEWGIEQPITSPTFNYVNCYENKQGQLLYHFDLYRIGTLDHFLQEGFDEYLYAPNSWCFIEWPEVIKPLLVQRVCNIVLDHYSVDQRLISYQVL